MAAPAKQKKEGLWTPANVVTLVRICLVPVFVLVLLSPWPHWLGLVGFSSQMKSLVAAGVFILISCTDWVDGYLARSRGEVTDFGKFMDPLADKILVAAALLALVELDVLPSWPVLIILAREFIVSGVRMIAATEGQVIAASWYGKAKTVFQIIAIVLFIVKDSLYLPTLGSALGNPLYLLSWAVMLVALVLTVVSMLDYLSKARHLLGFKPAKAASGVVAESSAAPVASGVELARGENVALEEGGSSSVGGSDDESGVSDALGVSGVLGAPDVSDALDVRLLEADVSNLAKAVVDKALQQKTRLATAESLTGGMISCALTGVPGSSAVVRGGIASYAIEVKSAVLGVSESLLSECGAVDARVAEQMADGARAVLAADVAVAVTGIAGPGGAEEGKPVGTVWLALSTQDATRSWVCHFAGDRECVRLQTTLEALRAIESVL